MERIFNILLSDFAGGALTGFRKGFMLEARRINLAPFTGKGGAMIQFTYLLPDRATHENLAPGDAAVRILELLRDRGYAQALLFAGGFEWHVTHYGKLKVRKRGSGSGAAVERGSDAARGDAECGRACEDARARACERAACDAAEGGGTRARACEGATAHHAAAPAHDRTKRRSIDADAPFLEELGVSRGGIVLPGMKDKYIQICRFIDLAAPLIPNAAHIHVIDFGCGKAYLTFAIYYYLRFILGREAEVIGVDLKADVLADCSRIALRLGYDGLSFVQGDIADNGGAMQSPDLVVALHACDTATDFAIDAALSVGAGAVVLAPCCQHELFDRVKSDALSPMLRGAMRERTVSLVTDALRILRLEAAGYKVEAVEFTSSEHTAKNLMLRAKKVRERDENAASREAAFRGAWGL